MRAAVKKPRELLEGDEVADGERLRSIYFSTPDTSSPPLGFVQELLNER
jgi:hypothetical protein